MQTKEGALRGYEWNGTCIFKGIPYAHAQRFRKPERIKPWDGVKEVQSYGYVSPLLHPEQPGGNGEMMVPHMYWPEKEDCQNLNIWTPSIRDGRKRPVMVWLHGGGFSTGSANEEGYDGQALSSSGDVVIVSVNHRLNVFGYFDLSAYGDKYKYSANVGLMDIVDSLKWIQDNIEAFGGDPENVTLFGQSGGGAKSPGDDDISVCERFIPEGNRPERRDRDHGSKIQHPGVQHGSCGEHLKESKYHTGQYRGYPVRVRG